MGETRVDLLHLLEDLRDAYPGSLEETIVTEIVANSLDSGARHIWFRVDAAEATFTVGDDGSGMSRKDVIRYHDLATSAKTRGQGIGFAGVGIKLGLLLCEDVITETKHNAHHLATRWSLAGRHKAPWKWIAPLGLVSGQGTGVRLRLQNGLSPLLDAGFIETTLRRCFQPLFDGEFDYFLSTHYPGGVGFEVNGSTLKKTAWQSGELVRLAICVGRRRKPSAVGYLMRADGPLPEDQQGIAVSTFGKVIKKGWDWLGLVPTVPDRVGGRIEAPELAAALTLNKGDFIRSGYRGALFLGYRKAIQEAVSLRLTEWGDQRETADPVKRRSLRPLERDFEKVLVELADEFPLLASLVERKAGGQKRLPIATLDEIGKSRSFVTVPVTVAEDQERDASAQPPSASDSEPSSAEETQTQESESSFRGAASMPGRPGRSRPQRFGLQIRFETHPDDPELGRLIESTVVVNQAHPAYHRAVASRSEGYHIALCVALAMARLAAEPKECQTFVTTFMTRWGEALDRARGKSRARP
ncbi:MAG: ATP-binding protein [Nitrospiraceae bacterium]